MRTIYDTRYIRVIELLRTKRRRLGQTQAEVASQLGWHRTVLSNIELGQRRMDILETVLLAGVYGLRLADLQPLLEREDNDDAKAK